MVGEKPKVIIKEKEEKKQNDFLNIVGGSWEDIPPKQMSAIIYYFKTSWNKLRNWCNTWKKKIRIRKN